MSEVTAEEALASGRKLKMFFKYRDVLWKGPSPTIPNRWYTIEMWKPLARTVGCQVPDRSLIPILEALGIPIMRRSTNPTAAGLMSNRILSEEQYNNVQIHPLMLDLITKLPNRTFVHMLRMDGIDNMPQILARPLIPYDRFAPDHDDAAYAKIEFLA